jgi:DNA-binding response OmpR family regulator
MRILLAEDDEPLALFLTKGLQADGYEVTCCPTGTEARDAAAAAVHPAASAAPDHPADAVPAPFDLAILDVNLPGLSGLDLLAYLRQLQPSLPVMLLTARDQVRDRVAGLDLGADDYLTKPFSFSELAARVRALLRRGNAMATVLRVADLELNRVERTVHRAGRRIELTPKEYALLEFLALHAHRRVTRAMILEHVWDLTSQADTKVVDVYINYLRGKLHDHGPDALIQTIRGVGYQLGPDL